jgi:hypothetical protein
MDIQYAENRPMPSSIPMAAEGHLTKSATDGGGTARFFFITWSRIFTFRFPYPECFPGANAHVSLTQVDRGDATGRPFIGAATMKVYNVAPGDHFIDIRGEIDWPDNIIVKLNVFIF